ncbi:hypothetical protein Hypma_014735, partial [Hypsizygus marmoreus]
MYVPSTSGLPARGVGQLAPLRIACIGWARKDGGGGQHSRRRRTGGPAKGTRRKGTSPPFRSCFQFARASQTNEIFSFSQPLFSHFRALGTCSADVVRSRQGRHWSIRCVLPYPHSPPPHPCNPDPPSLPNHPLCPTANGPLESFTPRYYTDTRRTGNGKIQNTKHVRPPFPFPVSINIFPL